MKITFLAHKTKMGRVQRARSDICRTLDYYAKTGHILPSYMFTPPHRQHGFLFKALANPSAQETQEDLRTNMLFMWLLGDFGPIDDFVITRSHVQDVFEAILGYQPDPHLLNFKIVVDKELKYWEHILLGEKRKSPLKIWDPPKYPVMIEKLDPVEERHKKNLLDYKNATGWESKK